MGKGSEEGWGAGFQIKLDFKSGCHGGFAENITSEQRKKDWGVKSFFFFLIYFFNGDISQQNSVSFSCIFLTLEDQILRMSG